VERFTAEEGTHGLWAVPDSDQRGKWKLASGPVSAVTDEVWHHHLRHGRSYRIMSRQLGRKYIGHNPFTTEAAKADGSSSYKRTLELIRATGDDLDAWVWPQFTQLYCDCSLVDEIL
jgi:hypothetical protein